MENIRELDRKLDLLVGAECRRGGWFSHRAGMALTGRYFAFRGGVRVNAVQQRHSPDPYTLARTYVHARSSSSSSSSSSTDRQTDRHTHARTRTHIYMSCRLVGHEACSF